MTDDLAASLVRRALSDANITVAELARRSHISRWAIDQLLRGERKCGANFATVALLLAACGWELEARRKQ